MQIAAFKLDAVLMVSVTLVAVTRSENTSLEWSWKVPRPLPIFCEECLPVMG